MTKTIVTALLATAALGSFGLGVATSAPAQGITVFDPANYAQNVLTAARTLQQINQQIRSLQNEATMLTGMAKNLTRIDFPQLDALRQKLVQIDRLMGQAQGLGYQIDQLEERFSRLFPDALNRALTTDQRVQEARARLDASMGGFRHAMTIQSQVVESVRDDAEALSAIVDRSQNAEGALQVGQATNQLLALTAKQQFQLQQMMAAQFRSEAVEHARHVQEREEARAATRRFLGSGRAYTPR